jgi:hypothetical protein
MHITVVLGVRNHRVTMGFLQSKVRGPVCVSEPEGCASLYHILCRKELRRNNVIRAGMYVVTHQPTSEPSKHARQSAQLFHRVPTYVSCMYVDGQRCKTLHAAGVRSEASS